MRSSTTIVTKNLKWPVCLLLALLIILQALPVMAAEQQTEQTETPTVTEVTGSESAQESAASGENNEIVADELEPIDLQEVATTSNSDWTTTKPHEGEVLHGGYVGFKNKESGKYLTIPNGTTATGTNVCQQSANSIANSQEFYLSYTYLPRKSVAYFTIYPVDASTGNAVSNRIKATYPLNSATSNVSVSYFMPTEMTDRWQIEHVHDNYYYIYIASRPGTTGTKYALTANSGEGTANGTATTATGNVYVSAYTGADNQLWQICVNNDPVNINGINIATETSLSGCAYPGETVAYYYIPKTFNEFVSWLSSSNDTCTIGQFGIVEGAHVGSATVTASVYNKNFSLTNAYTIEFHTLLRDGYYYIRSYYEDYLMDLEGGNNTDPNVPIQIWNTNGVVTTKSQVYKFTYVGDGCYNIQSFYGKGKGLKWLTTSTSIVNDAVKNENGLLMDSGKWVLKCRKYTKDGVLKYGVYIHAKSGIEKTITIPENYQNGTDLITTTYSASNNGQIWMICGDYYDIVAMKTIGDMVAGEQYELEIACVGATDLTSVSWSAVLGNDVVELDESIGVLRTLKPGNVTLRICIYNPDTDYVYHEYFPFTVYPSPSESDWFIKNALSGKVVSMIGYLETNVPVGMADYSDHADFEWEFERVSDNYFRIISKKSGLYLAAPANILTPVVQSNLENDYSLWKITPTSANRYKIVNKAYENSTGTLSIAGTDLYLYSYTADSDYRDEWYLNISGDELTILSVVDHDRLRAEAAIQAEANAEVYGVDCNLIISDHTSIQSALTGIATSKVFVSRSHGSKVSIGIYSFCEDDDGSITTRSLCVSDIYDYETNTAVVDLSNCELIVFIGCSTAACENGESITHAVVDAGAEAAIGFNVTIDASAGNEWMLQFLYNYYMGTTTTLLETVLLTSRQVGRDGTQDAVLYPHFDP